MSATPANKDILEDALKSVSLLVAFVALNLLVFKKTPNVAEFGLAIVCGLALHHYIVDRHIARIVVQEGAESFYMAKRQRRS